MQLQPPASKSPPAAKTSQHHRTTGVMLVTMLPCLILCRTFATETAASGQREFIVTSAQLFWDRYIQLPVQQRHSYEIIRQASPCNLYFGGSTVARPSKLCSLSLLI